MRGPPNPDDRDSFHSSLAGTDEWSHFFPAIAFSLSLAPGFSSSPPSTACGIRSPTYRMCLRDRVEASLLGRQDIKATTAQVVGQSGHDVAVEVQPDEERLRGRQTRHGLALPGPSA